MTVTRGAPIPCPNCETALPPMTCNRGRFAECPQCRLPVEVELFPAFFSPLPVSASGEPVLVPGESSCFFHPRKKASVACESCGRFLCALCDLDVHGQHLCPPCLESGQSKHRLQRLESYRTLYDNLALLLATVPVLMIWPTIVTAPLAIYLAVRHWNTPSSIIPRTRFRLVLALFLAAAQLLAWAAVLVFVLIL